MPTTTKKDLIDRIADETQQKRAVVKKTVQSFLDNVIRELSKGNRLEFRDFGVFEIRDRAPRIAQNPKTLEQVPVPAKKTVKFKVGRLMKLALDGEIDLDENLMSRRGARTGTGSASGTGPATSGVEAKADPPEIQTMKPGTPASTRTSGDGGAG